MRRPALCLGFLMAVWPTASADTYVVHPDGTGDFPTIQAAIDTCVDGDVVELTNGTFTGDGNRDIDFLGKAVIVRSQCGDPDSCIIDCDGTEMEPHRGFYFHSGEGPSSALDGVTITNGYAAGESPQHSGGAIHCEEASPTISNCIFRQNTAQYGGAMHLREGSATVFIDCAFQDNVALWSGGAVKLWDASPTFRGCVIHRNTAHAGAGVECGGWEPQSVTLEGCSLTDNTAVATAGGIKFNGSGSILSMGDCVISGNTAGEEGAGLHCSGGTYACSCEMTDCSVSQNISYGHGAGIYADKCLLSVDNSDILENWCNGWGAAAYYRRATASLANCRIQSNVAGSSGAGAWLEALNEDPSFAILTRCTVSDNYAYGSGSAVYLGSACSLEALGCTIALNTGTAVHCDGYTATILSNTIVAFTDNGLGVYCGLLGIPTLTCCNLYGNEDGDWVGFVADQEGVNGNFSADPCFCDMENDDYHLWNYSPCAQEGCGLIGAWPVGCWEPQAVGDQEASAVVRPGTVLFAAPNPFSESTHITYSSPGRGIGDGESLGIYDAGGRLVRRLEPGCRPSGVGSALWNGLDNCGDRVESGIYFVRVRGAGLDLTSRLMYLR